MRLLEPPPEIVPFGLRAMKMVATADRPLGPGARGYLAGVQRVLLHSDVAVDDLSPIEPAELAERLVDPDLRRQLIQGMMVVALSDDILSDAQMTIVESFAEALGVHGPELRALRLLADRHMALFRLDFARNTFLPRCVARSVRDEGLIGAARGVLGMRGLVEDATLAARYHALERLPEDTLGHAFTRHIRQNGFAYPGEKRGLAESFIWHDFGHVLGGYGTDPEGEMQIEGFQAGYMKDKPFFMVLFAVLTWSAGLNVTPLPQPHAGGIFTHAGLPARVLRAVQRGSKLTADLTDGWDHWAYVERPLEEVRALLHIEP
jgi:hypothetical protein